MTEKVTQIKLGDFLREIRLSRKFTLKDIADYLQIPVTGLSDVEFNRRHFSYKTIQCLLNYYKLTDAEYLQFKDIYFSLSRKENILQDISSVLSSYNIDDTENKLLTNDLFLSLFEYFVK